MALHDTVGPGCSSGPRTVEYHLHKVFTKLGTRSRSELELALGGGADGPPG